MVRDEWKLLRDGTLIATTTNFEHYDLGDSTQRSIPEPGEPDLLMNRIK